MSLDEIAPIPNDPAPEAAEPEAPAESVAEPVEERDEPEAPESEESLSEQLRRAQKAAERLSKEKREARDELERERKVYREMLEQFRPAAKPEQAAPAEPVEPDVQADPEGWLRWKFERMEKAAQEVAEWKRQQQQTVEQQKKFQSLVEDTARDYMAFAEEEAPDFTDAYEFVKKTLSDEYGSKPIFDRGRWRLPTKAEINERIAADEAGFVQQVRAAGGRPGPAIYEYAQMRGYKRSVAAAQLAESDQRRADAGRSRGLTAGSSPAPATLTYDWVVENIDSPDKAKRARAEKAWKDLDNLPRKR